MLKETDFYSEANSKIYEVIMELYKANKAIDLITVKEKLDDKNLLDKI
jgi:dnaB-like helicase N terminal domain